MGIPGDYKHERMREAYETIARAAKAHGKSMGVGGVRQDVEFQSCAIRGPTAAPGRRPSLGSRSFRTQFIGLYFAPFWWPAHQFFASIAP
jgi:hypothetical protein